MASLGADDLVLVAIMREPRDLELARVLGWYRIPLHSAPDIVQTDWIAFFLTAAFGEEKWSVRYLAKVEGHELVQRDELLRDEPDHPAAADPYIKITLGPLIQLAHPIPARSWRRFTFLLTSGQRLLSAREVRDLTLPSGSIRRGG
jgi:hypothetical protein